MASRLRTIVAALAALTFICEVAPDARARQALAPWYELIDLGIEGPTRDGGLWSEALGINERGAVVGHTSPGHAFVWTKADGRQTLPPIGPNDRGEVSATAYDINNDGAIVGASTAPRFDHRRATLWVPGNDPRDLGVLGLPPVRGMIGSVAYAINDRGVVVGESNTPPVGYSHAFIWTASGGMEDLGVLGSDAAGNHNSIARDINKHGVVIGRTTVNARNEVWHAFTWTRRTGMVDLTPALDYSDGWAINGRRWGAGSIADARVSPAESAVVWRGSRRFLNLGPGEPDPEESLFSIAFAISERGHVVGTMSSPAPPYAAAFLWTRESGKVDVNDLIDESGEGWRVVRGEDVNSRGQIVGSACRHNSICHAVLLTPRTRKTR